MTTTPTATETELAPWSEEEFVAALRAQGTRYHEQHPFHVRMTAGELSPEELRRWVANRYYYQRSIPIKDAAILSNCPEVEIRREWISRIIDHDGAEGESSGGIESWLRLGESLGGDRETIRSEELVLPGVRYSVDAYVNFCRQEPWVFAVASSLTELFGPGAIKVRLAGLEEHYPWIAPAGLEYFRSRLTLAPRAAQYALGVTLERCRTRADPERAVAGLPFKCDLLWPQLDAIARGDTRPAAAQAGS